MSESGWQEFLRSDGLGDWVVLHGGATAVFRVASLVDSAQLAEAVSAIAGAETEILMTVASDRLTVRLTRDVWQLEEIHVAMGRAVSATARTHGSTPDRSAVQEVQVTIAATPDCVDVGFWRVTLGYSAVADDNAVDPLGHGSTVWMPELDPTKPLRHAMHVDVSVAHEHAEQRVAAAIAAGGQIVDDSRAPESWTLADSAGNRVCVAAWPDGAAMIDAPARLGD